MRSFMKKLFYPLLLLTIFSTSCSNTNDEQDQDNDPDSKNKKVTSRDLGINSANAYNTLFLDSLEVANYLTTNDLGKKNTRRFLSFYNARNFQYAWFAKDGLTEQARGFFNLYVFDAKHKSDSLTIDKKLHAAMDNLFAQENLNVDTSNRFIKETELKLTRLFIDHGLEMYEDGYVKRKEMERFVPLKKTNAVYLADSLLNKKHKDNKYFEDISEPYKKLKNELARYVEIQKKGGWPTLPDNIKGLKPGTSSPVIQLIKKRLQLTGDMQATDTTAEYNTALEHGVKSMQSRFGYTADGIINQRLIKDMNVPVESVIEQMVINLDRMRWMPSIPKGIMILVNIPEFVLHVKNGPEKLWDMNVVVGKEGHNTMMFTDDLNQIVFSPYWNVPPSIVKNEIVPKMSSDPDYLSKQNMEVVKNEGSLPVIRQLPGPKNSLGKVKFLFPNSFNIYFHDTPAKSLFSKDQRAYSHGCIRLSDPAKLASFLLKDRQEWTPSTIDAAMNSGTEKVVKLSKPVPVFITYYTTWVDEQGKLNFRDDIYGHDKSLIKKMFIAKG